MAAAEGKVVLVLDALNQLEDRDGAPDLVWLPPAIPANVRLILSTLPGRSLTDLMLRGWPTLTIDPLHPEERRALIEQYLAPWGKALSAARAQRIAAAPQSANPLYLRALLDELRVFGAHEQLEVRIAYYLAAQTIPQSLYQRILARYEEDYEPHRPHLRFATRCGCCGRRVGGSPRTACSTCSAKMGRRCPPLGGRRFIWRQSRRWSPVRG